MISLSTADGQSYSSSTLNLSVKLPFATMFFDTLNLSMLYRKTFTHRILLEQMNRYWNWTTFQWKFFNFNKPYCNILFFRHIFGAFQVSSYLKKHHFWGLWSINALEHTFCCQKYCVWSHLHFFNQYHGFITFHYHAWSF